MTMRTCSIMLALLCSATFVRAQEIKHEVTVTLKLIQVYVMDKAGDPVSDLKVNDFIIYDNKKTQIITEFEHHVLFPQRAKIATPLLEKELMLPSTSDRSINRKFLLFFDLANNSFNGFQKAQEAALHFIDNELHPSDEVGVLTFSTLRGLTLHEFFTKDRDGVRRTIEEISKGSLVGRIDNFEAMIWRELTGESAADASQPSMPIKSWVPPHLQNGSPGLTKAGIDNWATTPEGRFKETRSNRAQQKDLSKRLVSKITDLSKALRYIPGNKHILMFSSGIPYSLIYGIEAPGQINKELGPDFILQDQYKTMLKELSDANVTVFSLNTESLSTDIKIPSHMKGEETLRSMSLYTGGKFLGNVQNYFQILDMVKAFTGSYYVLGFYVPESWDGRYHKLKVEVDRPGCEVFAQKGYFNPKPFSKYTDIERELHLVDIALSERPLYQDPFNIPMTAIPCPLGKEQGLCLLTKLPWEKLKERIKERAEIYFLIFDEKENIVELKRRETEYPGRETEAVYSYSIFPLSPGSYKCSIVLRDMDTGSSAVGRSSVEIPELPVQNLRLFPPLLLVPGKSGIFIRGYVPKSMRTDFPLLECFPFDPAKNSPVIQSIPRETKKIQAVLHCSTSNLDQPLLKFFAFLIDETTESSPSLPVSILSAKKSGEFGILTIEIEMPEMTPGDYELILATVDTLSLEKSQASIALKVF